LKRNKKRLIIGITGIAGSGKSTFASVFEELGAKVITADEDVRQIIENLKDEIVSLFGKEVLEGDRLDRKKLGEKVFSSKDNYEKFNSLIFPHIKAHAEKIIQEKDSGIWVFDAALIHEYDLDPLFDVIITVKAPYEICIERFMSKTGYSREIAEMVINSQLSQEEKAKRSHIVVENTGSIEDLKRIAREIFAKITRNAGFE